MFCKACKNAGSGFDTLAPRRRGPAAPGPTRWPLPVRASSTLMNSSELPAWAMAAWISGLSTVGWGLGTARAKSETNIPSALGGGSPATPVAAEAAAAELGGGGCSGGGPALAGAGRSRTSMRSQTSSLPSVARRFSGRKRSSGSTAPAGRGSCSSRWAQMKQMPICWGGGSWLTSLDAHTAAARPTTLHGRPERSRAGPSGPRGR
mmetsp:Transcript_59544/g.192646  ORF Transcript_59544/g.192646 Transcript_59544/m.192646 type:complete len:206 (+) Transcript_59544:642-1259(+)